MTRERFEEYKRLIWKAAHRFSGQAEVSDLYHIGCQTYERCCEHFDAACGSFEVYLFRACSKDMLRNMKRDRYESGVDFEELLDARGEFAPDGHRSMMFHESIEQLSDDARHVVGLVMSPPCKRLENHKPKRFRGWLRRHLQVNGWSTTRIYDAFHEIENMLAETA